MGIASIVLGILSFLCAMGGFLVSFLPGVGAIPGAMLSLSSPLFALIGIVLGGVALSRAKEEGSETGLPTAGLIVSGIAFFPAFFVAISCGLCDILCASAQLSGNNGRPGGATPYYLIDAGPSIPPASPQPGYPDPNAVPDPNAPVDPNDPNAPFDPRAVDPSAVDPRPVDPVDPNQPPPAFPPPPPVGDPGSP